MGNNNSTSFLNKREIIFSLSTGDECKIIKIKCVNVRRSLLLALKEIDPNFVVGGLKIDKPDSSASIDLTKNAKEGWIYQLNHLKEINDISTFDSAYTYHVLDIDGYFDLKHYLEKRIKKYDAENSSKIASI
jgi:hypothetical protein